MLLLPPSTGEHNSRFSKSQMASNLTKSIEKVLTFVILHKYYWIHYGMHFIINLLTLKLIKLKNLDLSQIVYIFYGGSSAVLPGAARLVSLQLPPRMLGFTATHQKRWEPKRGRRSLRPRALAAHRL